MLAENFHHWIEQVNELTPYQRQQALNWLHQELPVIDALLDRVPACPHCHGTACVHWGSAHGLARYRCKGCHKTFNALTGTPMAHLRHRTSWHLYAQALIEGLPVREAARRCGVYKSTAFRWRHRFLRLPTQQQPARLSGIVEADETYFLQSRKGERQLGRAPRKRGGVASKRGLSAEQIPVLIARDRNANTTDAVLQRADTQSIREVLGPLVASDALLCSDGNAIYQRFAKQAHLAHKRINLNAGVRVLEHAFHIQNVNAYDSRLKTWMRRFHGVATKYLPSYLGWRRCLERLGNTITPAQLLSESMGINT